PELVPLTEHHVFRAHQMDKIEMLVRVLQADGRGLTMVFCRTKRTADQVAGALTTRGFAAAAMHGDLGQAQRERALRAFRHGKMDVLIATDVAARGLEVEDVTHRMNFECPEDDKAYLHRIGRTGRAGRSGVAVTFVDWNDMTRWKVINGALGLGHPEPPETYSTSEHLFRALGIPADAGSRLAPDQKGRQGRGGGGAGGLRGEGPAPLRGGPLVRRGRARPPPAQTPAPPADQGRRAGGYGESRSGPWRRPAPSAPARWGAQYRVGLGCAPFTFAGAQQAKDLRDSP